MPDLINGSTVLKPTVFLSYASEDREAARLIGEALPSLGLEVWFDQSELGGGEAWDQKIRRQIRECDYFMALVSAQTEARHEGYFRREWRLAVERSLDIADDHLYLLPVVIDDTVESRARVPEKFLSVQWLRLPGGRPSPALEALCQRLLSGETASSSLKKATSRAVRPERPVQQRAFPKEEQGQKVRFWFEVMAWTIGSAWAAFKRLPGWIRILLAIWVGLVLVHRISNELDRSSPAGLSRLQEEKLEAITRQYHGSDKTDLTNLATQIAQEFSDNDDPGTPIRTDVLAIPFAAPKGDTTAESIAGQVFAQVYGRIAIARHGKIGLGKNEVPVCSIGSVLALTRESHNEYAVCGYVGTEASDQKLNVQILNVSNSSVLWSKSYPIAGADPEKIAVEVSSNVPPPDDD